MHRSNRMAVGVVGMASVVLLLVLAVVVRSPQAPHPGARPDAVQDAQIPRTVPVERPEQQKAAHDRSPLFLAPQAVPASQALAGQPEEGKVLGFDFYRDPLNAKQPMQTLDEVMQADVAAKPQVMATQRQLLERRYHLQPQLDTQVTMSRGKPIPIGPTARLPQGGVIAPFPKLTSLDVGTHKGSSPTVWHNERNQRVVAMQACHHFSAYGPASSPLAWDPGLYSQTIFLARI